MQANHIGYLWKITVDPSTLQATAIERLTTGLGLDTQVAVSADGRKLAFTVEAQHIQAWLFPFDATNGRVTGTGSAATSPGMESWWPNLSRDGKKLAFQAIRAGKDELWEKSLVNGREAPIQSDGYQRGAPQWSPDGTQLAYTRAQYRNEEYQRQVVVWSSQTHSEDAITALSTRGNAVYDWSPDGKLLVSLQNSDTHLFEVWLLTMTDAKHTKVSAQKILSHPVYGVYQPHMSPDGRWNWAKLSREKKTQTPPEKFTFRAGK